MELKVADCKDTSW